MTTFAHDMLFGARVQDDGVRFRLWAPGQNKISLLLEGASGSRMLPMTDAGTGWFERLSETAGPGTRYAYALPDGSVVPDPASRFQPDDVHGPSEVIDPHAYAWRQPQWRGRPWREAVLYEAHIGAFTAAGDYDAMRAKLDHLTTLGVSALELMPVSDFDGARNWGYDGVLPFAPDASYGRPEALKQLVDAAHERGLMILLDVVYNHFGPSGNYLAKYAPPFFTDRWDTPWGQAIDFSRKEVRRFFIHNALYWLDEYRFDGLRLDAVDQIHDTSHEHILAELARTVRERITDRHVHLVLENDDNAAHYLERGAPPDAIARYNAQWNDDFHHAAHVLATGEESGYYVDYAQHPTRAFARALAQGFVYQGKRSTWRERARGEPSAALPPPAFVNFVQNHDQVGNRARGERLAQLADAQAVEALTVVLLLAPAIPLLFMGEEWGARQPFLYFCDYDGELAAAVCHGRRREFCGSPGFADAHARRSIPDPNAESTFAQSVLDWDGAATPAGKSRMQLVRKLLAIRRREIVPWLDADLHGGTYSVVERALRVDWPLADGASLHLAANLGPSTATGIDRTLPGEIIYAHPELPTSTTFTHLPPWTVLWSRA